jgi:hypothetical protein
MSGTETRGDGELTFYYSREHRLEHASETVRQMNDPVPKKRLSMIRTLTATKSSAFLFISIIVLLVMSGLMSYVISANRLNVAGNTITVSAERAEGATFLVLRKTAKKDNYTGVVDLAVSVVGGADNTGTAGGTAIRLVFSSQETEEFRFSVPLEADELLVVMLAGTKSGQIKVKPGA